MAGRGTLAGTHANEGIEYAKVPLDVWEIAQGLENRGQQDKLIGAYVRYFFTGDPADVPKSIYPAWIVAKGIADRIKTGIITGGRRTKGKRGKRGENPTTSQGQVGEKSATSRGEVGQQSASSQDESGPLPADSTHNPTTYPRTQYKYKDKYKDTHKHEEDVSCGVQDDEFPY